MARERTKTAFVVADPHEGMCKCISSVIAAYVDPEKVGQRWLVFSVSEFQRWLRLDAMAVHLNHSDTARVVLVTAYQFEDGTAEDLLCTLSGYLTERVHGCSLQHTVLATGFPENHEGVQKFLAQHPDARYILKPGNLMNEIPTMLRELDMVQEVAIS